MRSLSSSLVWALLIAGPAGPVLAQAERPNIVVVLADDLGWGDLGCYGQKRYRTPHLDRLAAGGVRFSDFYAPYPYCAPSRASLLTGRYPFRTGLVQNPVPAGDPLVKDTDRFDRLGLPTSELTLARLLHDAGYVTCAIGKWHLGHRPEFWPTRHGFQRYFGIPYSNDMKPVRLYRDAEMIEYPVVQATLTQRYTMLARQFIRDNKDRPFFLYLAHAMPHKPLACSETFYHRTGAGLYADVLTELDWSVGQIVEELQRTGVDRRTLLFFTSDNGPWYGGSTGGLRGMKGNTWEGGIRVPLLVSMPGTVPPGRVSAAPAMLPDLFTTILLRAGVPLPKDRTLDGLDLWPAITDNKPLPERVLYFFRQEQLMALRSGRWKLHLGPPGGPRKPLPPGAAYKDPRGPDGVTILAPYEQAHPSQFPGLLTGDAVTDIGLFDLENDPAEQHNLAERHPQLVQTLLRHAAAMRADMEAVKSKR